MVLGKLPEPRRPTVWMLVGQGPIALAVGAGGGLFGHFNLLCPFSPLSPSLWETTRYRLKKLSQRVVKSKTTNQNHPTQLLQTNLTSYGYMQERYSHSTHTPLIEIIA